MTDQTPQTILIDTVAAHFFVTTADGGDAPRRPTLTTATDVKTRAIVGSSIHEVEDGTPAV